MRRAHLLIWAFVVAASSAIALWMVRDNPGGLLRPCPFRALTGVPCPACGTTQGLRDLSSGQFGAALRSNPLAAALAVVALASGIAAIVLLPWAGRLRPPRIPSRRTFYWVAFILLVANWAYLIGASLR